MGSTAEFHKLLPGREAWLASRAFSSASRDGLAEHAPCDDASWAQSVHEISAALTETLLPGAGLADLSPEGGGAAGPPVAAGLRATERLGGSDATPRQVLGLIKCFREAYSALIVEGDEDAATRLDWLQALDRAFDRLELGLCSAGVLPASGGLCESRELLVPILDAISAPVFYKDAEGVYLGCNRAFAEFVGLSKEEVVGKTVFDVAHDGRGARHHEEDLALLEHGGAQVYESAAVGGDGQMRRMVLRKAPLYSADGSVRGIVGIMLDVTESRRTEEALTQSERRYRELFEKAPLGIFATTSEGQGLIGNPAMARMLGCATPEDAVRYFTEQPGTIYVQPGRRREFIALLRERGAADGFEYEALRADGRRVWIGMDAHIVDRHEDGTFTIEGFAVDITKRKQAEQALRDSESRYRALIENANSVVLEVDLDWRVIFANEYAERFFGFRRSELLGRSVLDTIVPETESTGRDLRALLKAILADPEVHGTNVNENRTRDGRRVWVAWTNRVIIGPDGEPTGLLCIGSDITARKVAEDELRRSESRFRAVFNGAAVGIVVTALDGRPLDCNEAALQMLGMTKQQFRATPAEQVIHPDDRDHDPTPWLELVAGKRASYRREMRLLRPDGDIVWTRLTVSLAAYGSDGETAIITMVENVTDRKQVEEALREREERYRAFIESTDDLVFLKDEQFRYLIVNRANAEFLERTEEQIVGRTDFDLMPEEMARSCRQSDLQALASEDAVISEETACGRTYETRKFRASVGEGRTGVGGYIRDITDRRRAEESQRLATVGQLAAGVAHDFNNLLTGMAGTAQLVEMGRGDAAELVRIVRRSARSGAEITKNLMAFARPDEPRRKLGRVEASLDAALAVAARQLANAEVAVLRRYPANGLPVLFDAAQMEQVFLNLIINACHAMPKGGTLTIRTDYQASDPACGELLVEVTDTGTGIAPEHLSRVFEPFFTTKGRLGESETPGSGLGLSVSHGLVAAHGGSISARSTLGQGTTLSIRLPFASAATAPAVEENEVEAALTDVAHLKGARVLVAEDESGVLTLLEQVLKMVGCELTMAASAVRAVEALRAQPFDLVLSDLMMPGGGGWAVLAAVKELASPPRVVIMTGRLERSMHDEVLALGARDTIEKPFDLVDLLQVLGSAMEQRL